MEETSNLQPQSKEELYTCLPLVDDQIRILTLHAGEWDTSIHCSLTKVALMGHRGSYKTLSYVWGNLTDTRTIWLEGVEVQVTKSLEDALRHLRLVYGEMVIWIDALCINVGATQRLPIMGHFGTDPSFSKMILENDRGRFR